ncbi:hypothetical protein JIQ42_07128 [Leishmania sp. Namibia]|uniref:hypothetical protein n=1 Tax=Leishmania sp. Namibia TaxID=2802991 RepID=UPI001B647C0B|nr:hypothetical protein JIQ42_07128 [Leishmania sp. Namibia]
MVMKLLLVAIVLVTVMWSVVVAADAKNTSSSSTLSDKGGNSEWLRSAMDAKGTSPTLSTKTATPATKAAACAVLNCITCDSTNPSVCVKCKAGYKVDRLGQCMATDSCNVAHCAVCFPDDSRRCATCASGYMQTASFMCVPERPKNAACRTSSLVFSVAVAVGIMALAAI